MGGLFSSPSPTPENNTKNPVKPPTDEVITNVRNERHVITGASFENQNVKILTLGSGECGKTTLWRQLKITYCGGFKESERRNLINSIRTMIISDVQTLINAAESGHQSFGSDVQNDVDYIKEIDPNCIEELDSTVAQAISRIWNDPITKIVYEQANSLGIGENIGYFLDNVNRIADPSYKPTDEDLLKARIRTTGRNEIKFKVDDIQTILVDVGGQKNERRNWAKCFQNVDYVLFIVSLSDFDQKLFEEDSVTRTEDSIECFTNIVGTAFPSTPVFLVLNKHDLFLKKLRKNPDAFLASYPGFVGNVNDPEACLDHVKRCYLNRIDPNRPTQAWIDSLPACAMDQDNVRNLFQCIGDRIVAEKSF